jgi:hypothetical protein
MNPGVVDDAASVVRWGESTRTIPPAFRAVAAELRQLAAEAGDEHPIDRAFAEAMEAEARRMEGMAEIADGVHPAVRAQAHEYYAAYETPRFGSLQREARADSGPAADGQ